MSASAVWTARDRLLKAPVVRRAAATASPIPTYELAGPPNAPVVVVLGGISATRHVTSSDESPGWWEAVVGQGRFVDTRRWRVLGVDFLDGGRGPNGRPARTITTHDQAAAIAALADRLAVPEIHAIVGASYGGMVGLAFAERFPERLGRLVVISAAHESHPMSTALRALQRRVVELGLESGRGWDAMVIARGIAMTTYRTAHELAERFGDAQVVLDERGASFAVERYLAHCGERFAENVPPERFLALSLSADLHRIDPAAVRVPATIVAADGDLLVPAPQTSELVRRLGGPSRLIQLPTRCGHDAFLAEPATVGPVITSALLETVQT